MNKITLLLLSVLVLSSCQANQNRYNSPREEGIDTSAVVADDSVVDDKSYPISDDSIAIGNINMGCSRKEFEKGKRDFLSKHKKLANIEIDIFEPTFINGKLARIIIKSRKYKDSGTFDPGWEDLYHSKYPGKNTRNIMKGFIRINVLDSEVPMNVSIDGLEAYSKYSRAIIIIEDSRVLQDYFEERKQAKENKHNQEIEDI